MFFITLWFGLLVGSSGGLSVVMNAEQYEYFTWSSTGIGAGFYVRVHDQTVPSKVVSKMASTLIPIGDVVSLGVKLTTVSITLTNEHKKGKD